MGSATPLSAGLFMLDIPLSVARYFTPRTVLRKSSVPAEPLIYRVCGLRYVRNPTQHAFTPVRVASGATEARSLADEAVPLGRCGVGRRPYRRRPLSSFGR